MAIRRKSKGVPAMKDCSEWLYYPDWVVAQTEIPIEQSDACIAAIDDGKRIGPGVLPPVRREYPRDGGGSSAAAARAMREAEAAVHRSDYIVARETGQACDFVDDTLRQRC